MNIKDFVVGDIIYIRRNVSGYSVNLKCNFLGMKKGLIIEEIIEIESTAAYDFCFPIHSEIKARKNMCYIRMKRIFKDGTNISNGCWWLNAKTGDFE